MDKSRILILLLILMIFISGCKTKIVGIKPILDENELYLLETLSVRELLENQLQEIQQRFPLEKAKIALPATLEINILDKNQKFYVNAIKEGKVTILNEIYFIPDVVIRANEEDLKVFFLTETKQEFITNAKDIKITALTFKGKLGSQIIEDYIDVKIVKDKTISQKTMMVVTKPVVGFLKIIGR